ncbi:hypothetical protein P0082_00025 [Candidatus Haliotispira prima]|uniref:Uncharacterized protein n=1 Tax=Candidatus Haliotispira prima TaxID=3034016 RepID=A0ABY8MGX6_9SPIO|nr:hypothetical protein P0082_12465 [Candidatus Haliotispira prima]WGK69278.1 hypothetical protein P0082_00025 [Candidatus Haliotispira prima]
MASSLQLEISSNVELVNIGAVARLASEAAPTKAGTEASAGYVSLGITAGSPRKFSISQHYGSDFTDGGFTLADVLAPNTKYKLYLYMPSAIDLAQTSIKGGEIKEDRVEISFTTASLPLAGDTVWSEKWTAKEYVASLNEYHFMESQTGVIVAYFQIPFSLLLYEVLMQVSNGTFDAIGNYSSGRLEPSLRFYFNYGVITGYTTGYNYVILADKQDKLKRAFRSAIAGQLGEFQHIINIISRY